MKTSVAILKDSLREAWDSKTLLVMLILSVVFLALVASIGYTAATPKATVEQSLRDLSAPVVRLSRGKFTAPMVDRGNGRPYAHPDFTLTTFKTLKEGSHESTGEHEFTVVVKNATLPGEPKDTAPKADVTGVAPAGPAPAGEEVLEKYVAAWHDSKGDKLRVEDRAALDPAKWHLVAPVTEEMVREYFAAEFEKDSQLPVVGFERLPTDAPGERVYKVTTGPSAEPRLWPVKFSVLFGAWESPFPIPLGYALYTIQDLILSSVGGLLIILIAVIVTSFFIPNMLRPGSVVMLLSKPVSRASLLLLKYIGGLFFVLILAGFLVGGVWLITGIRAGVWAPGVLAVAPLLTLSFAILYAVSTAAAVLTRNSIVAILVTLAVGGTLWLVGKVEFYASVKRAEVDAVAELTGEEAKYSTWTNVSGGLNRTLPRWHDIDVITGHTVADSLMTDKQQEARGTAVKKHLPSWGGTLGVTALWIAALLGFSIWRFSAKDY